MITREVVPAPAVHPDDSGQVIFLGPDQRLLPRASVFEADAGDLTIIHAMRLRRGYRELYEDVMRWQ